MVLLRKASSLDFLWKEFLLWQTLQDFWFPCQQVNSSCMLIQKSQKKNLCKISDSVVSRFDPHPLSADGHGSCNFHIFHRKDISPVNFQNYVWKLYICLFLNSYSSWRKERMLSVHLFIWILNIGNVAAATANWLISQKRTIGFISIQYFKGILRPRWPSNRVNTHIQIRNTNINIFIPLCLSM